MTATHRQTATPGDSPDVRPRCLVTLEEMPSPGISLAGQRELSGSRGGFPAHVELRRQDLALHIHEHMQRMSISGMQDKISLKLVRGRLMLVDTGGSHILKPIPATPFQLANDLPANEHATMLIAKRLGIRTAACGLIHMLDDEMAYITRRFDRSPDGAKIQQEDFGSLADMSADTHGKNWKYECSYEGLGRLIARHCSAQRRDLQEFYRRVVFCFLIGNGDAHMRNFSVLRNRAGLVQLSPAYDLVCTPIHMPQDTDLCLAVLDRERQGTFSRSFAALGFYSRTDFLSLATAISLTPHDAMRVNDELSSQAAVESISHVIRRSFLSDEAQESYLDTVRSRFEKFHQGP